MQTARTRGELQASGYQVRTVRAEMRRNLLDRLSRRGYRCLAGKGLDAIGDGLGDVLAIFLALQPLFLVGAVEETHLGETSRRGGCVKVRPEHAKRLRLNTRCRIERLVSVGQLGNP